MLAMTAAALIALLITTWLTPKVKEWAVRRGVVDHPEARRINKAPLPRAGGIAIFIGFLVAAVLAITARQLSSGKHDWTFSIFGVLVAVTVAALFGLIDDLYDLPAKWQALALIAIGLLLFLLGVRIEGVSNPFTTINGAYNPTINWHPIGLATSIILTILWVFTVVKTVDAIDGVDGLAAGVCAISAATLALMSAQLHPSDGPTLQKYDGPTLALLASAIVGACIGFLRHNYHPARIIMGTVGAWVLGTALAAISILGAFKVATAVSVLVPILVLGVPIFDYVHVVTRRVLARAPLTRADKRHLHHLLLARGWSQTQVTYFLYGLTFLLCLSAYALFQLMRAH